jgi:hypothetical protein
MWIGIAMLVWFVVQQPLTAAHLARQGGDTVSHVQKSGTAILNNLSGSGKP